MIDKEQTTDPGPPAPPVVRKIIHIDMDAFYASVEQRDNPQLRGRPVAVGRESQRGVVAAASYEARRLGVRSAMPSVTARRRAPELIFVPPRFAVYRAISTQIRQILTSYTDLVEPLSLDEAYLDVTENKAGMAIATQLARAIRAHIRRETGLTASAGISYCKFLAKMASDLNKPDGQAVITPARGPQFLAALPVRKFHGVGPATATRMEQLGIFTGADLRARSAEFLRQHFGKAGQWYHQIARGLDDRPVRPDRPRKSIGTEDTFLSDITDADEARTQIVRLSARVWHSCAARELSGRTVTLKVKYADFRQITRSRTMDVPMQSADDLARLALFLLESVLPLEQGVRLLGVTLSALEPLSGSGDPQQLSLGLDPAPNLPPDLVVEADEADRFFE